MKFDKIQFLRDPFGERNNNQMYCLARFNEEFIFGRKQSIARLIGMTNKRNTWLHNNGKQFTEETAGG